MDIGKGRAGVAKGRERDKGGGKGEGEGARGDEKGQEEGARTHLSFGDDVERVTVRTLSNDVVPVVIMHLAEADSIEY